ncbi:hypothetical protein VFPPC_14846 [Pochonia chlamydosporia 170]|uniref:Uncharacterized protein n=1 Tax=Pochonia chlamydosporia 170 TaxID=1380566 RepID=A0A179EZN8_METCM|nr:hypothetical protein VFPPC_14846 [Pochonia chlamydosporia 170]OAQ58667.1 hypothetical protein VFPPC_14846 [Pochonia chlamydosporia 170]
MLNQASISLLLGVASLTNAQSCGGGGSFTVNNVQENFGSLSLQPRSASLFHQGNAQICIVNRAPNTVVTISGTQINGAISAVLNKCCTNAGNCGGGQQKITGPNGNVIDLSVQAQGQNCTP